MHSTNSPVSATCTLSANNCTLQHLAPPCNTLQHPTTPCTTLHHPATHCNTQFVAASRILPAFRNPLTFRGSLSGKSSRSVTQNARFSSKCRPTGALPPSVLRQYHPPKISRELHLPSSPQLFLEVTTVTTVTTVTPAVSTRRVIPVQGVTGVCLHISPTPPSEHEVLINRQKKGSREVQC